MVISLPFVLGLDAQQVERVMALWESRAITVDGAICGWNKVLVNEALYADYWRCLYCGSLRPNEMYKCPNCGASGVVEADETDTIR